MRRAAGTPIAGMMFALVLAACTSALKEPAPASVRNGEVGVEDLTATIASSARIALAGNENFLPPLAEPDNRPPVYPAELLAQRLPPQAVCLRVSVSEEGEVSSSSPFVRPPDCAALDAAAQLFLGAAQIAVSAWRYDPAVRCVFERGPRPDYPTCVGARETPQAVSLTYRFVFEQQNGHGSVRTTP
jgi:hypothetical protein